jgi:hypothetical protein
MSKEPVNKENKPVKSPIGREVLNKKFENGKIPTQDDFWDLTNSMVNKLDDGFRKDPDYGFMFIPSGSDRIVSFKKKIDDTNIFLSFEKDLNKPGSENEQSPASDTGDTDNNTINYDDLNNYECMRINPVDHSSDDPHGLRSFYFHTNGNLGIGKKATSDYHKLEVNGFLASAGRVGTYNATEEPPQLRENEKGPRSFLDRIWETLFSKKGAKGKSANESAEKEARKPGQVPADGKWHKIVDGLDNCNAFEVIARCGKVNRANKTGKFALLHAIAVSSFGMGKIKKTSSHFSPTWSFLNYWNKINLKWHGDTHDYSLWIRTNSFYGERKGNDAVEVEQIFYRITKLWDDKSFTEKDYYYDGSSKKQKAPQKKQ